LAQMGAAVVPFDARGAPHTVANWTLASLADWPRSSGQPTALGRPDSRTGSRPDGHLAALGLVASC